MTLLDSWPNLADGPESETPPGHWNTLANDLADSPGFELRLFGQGETVDRLTWDVHIYLALNGALHDAAIAAWELSAPTLTSRPITLIRTLGARGQRSEPSGPSYHPDGLPLEQDSLKWSLRRLSLQVNAMLISPDTLARLWFSPGVANRVTATMTSVDLAGSEQLIGCHTSEGPS